MPSSMTQYIVNQPEIILAKSVLKAPAHVCRLPGERWIVPHCSSYQRIQGWKGRLAASVLDGRVFKRVPDRRGVTCRRLTSYLGLIEWTLALTVQRLTLFSAECSIIDYIHPCPEI